MNGQGNNRILPIKSLLENLKQESKRQYLHMDNKSGHANLHENNQTIAPQTHRDHPHHDGSVNFSAKDLKKGISLNKHNEKTPQYPFTSREIPPPVEQGFNFYVPKRERNNCEKPNRYANHPQEPFRLEIQTDHYAFSNKNNKSEQILYHQTKHQIKTPVKNCDATIKFSEEYDRQSSMLTEKMNSKFQEETRSFSKFEKMESQPIFKDELTKIKTQLFHKQAMLFTKTQELEEKDKMIYELQTKLERKFEKIPAELIEKIKHMEATIKSQSNQIDFLRSELDQSKEIYNKYQEDTTTNYTLINLKLRQYEAEERQKSFQISEMKEKQKKKYDQQEKTIKGLKQLLKDKEDAVKQANFQLKVHEESLKASQTLLKEKEKDYSKQLEIKETFIRQLSAEIGDLKRSLKSMEERIREMIEEESEMKQISSKFNEARALHQEKEKLNEANIFELRNRINQLNEIVFKRESSLIAFKEKNNELEEKLKKTAQTTRANSPPKTSSSTSKLIKDNERLSAIAKDFDKRLYQSMKLNEALNEEVIKRDLIILNASYVSKLAASLD